MIRFHRPFALFAVLVLSACAQLPADGPSARAVAAGGAADAAQRDRALGGYAQVDVDYGVAEALRIVGQAETGSLAEAASDAPLDLIGVGDQLTIAIYEPSGALFGSRGEDGVARAGSATLPPVIVDRGGVVMVPFAGRVQVADLTSSQAADAIRRALVGKVASPQVVVSIAESPSRGVTVLGEVRQPGRAPLSPGADRLLDAIAAAGGASRPVEDIEVAIQRDGRAFTAPLSVVTTAFDQNVRLARGDQINLIHRPRRYSVFGALGQIDQAEMGAGVVTLAGAISDAGGLDDQAADARSVFVFRFERPEVARALGLTQAETPRGVPVVYRVDLSQGAGVFAASTFEIRPGDVIHAPRTRTAEARKFFEFVQSVTRVVYDISVTSALDID